MEEEIWDKNILATMYIKYWWINYPKSLLCIIAIFNFQCVGRCKVFQLGFNVLLLFESVRSKIHVFNAYTLLLTAKYFAVRSIIWINIVKCERKLF